MEPDSSQWTAWTAETTRLPTLPTALRRRLPIDGAFKRCQRITIDQLQAVQLFGGTSKNWWSWERSVLMVSADERDALKMR